MASSFPFPKRESRKILGSKVQRALSTYNVYFIYSLQSLWIPPLFPVIWITLEFAGSFSFIGYAFSPLFLSLFFFFININHLGTWYANPILFNKSAYWWTWDWWIILIFMPVCLVFRVEIVTPEGCFQAPSLYRVYVFLFLF